MALLAAPVRAENKTPPAARAPLSDTVIVYEATAGCPSRTDFEDRLWSRMPAHESASISPRRIEARLQRSGTRVAGSVVLTDASGAVTTRRIVAASCSEAVDALALIVALTVDPMEAHGGTPPPQEDGATAPGAAGATHGDRGDATPGETKTNAPAPTSVPKPPVDTGRSPPPAPPVSGVQESSAAVAPSSRRSRFGVSASFLVASGVVPGASPGGEVAVVASTSGVPALSLRFGGRLVASAGTASDEGEASFSWWSGFAGGCLGSDASAALVLSGCAVYELGRLGAGGSRTENPSSSGTMWQALGPELRFEWVFAAPFALNAGVAGMFPLRAERFWLGNDVVFRVPPAGIRAEIGAVVRF
jgi:hypothetical protein